MGCGYKFWLTSVFPWFTVFWLWQELTCAPNSGHQSDFRTHSLMHTPCIWCAVFTWEYHVVLPTCLSTLECALNAMVGLRLPLAYPIILLVSTSIQICQKIQASIWLQNILHILQLIHCPFWLCVSFTIPTKAKCMSWRLWMASNYPWYTIFFWGGALIVKAICNIILPLAYMLVLRSELIFVPNSLLLKASQIGCMRMLHIYDTLDQSTN